jgi:hypothetical protein
MQPFSQDMVRPPVPPLRAWSETPHDIEELAVIAVGRTDLAQLALYQRIKTLWISQLNARGLDVVAQLPRLEKLIIVELKAEQIVPLGRLRKLRQLIVWGAQKLYHLTGVETLANLQLLTVHNFPKLDDLTPLASLTQLRTLALLNSDNAIATGRPLIVDSFDPLARLHDLEWLELIGVIPRRSGLEPLRGLRSLKHLEVSNSFSVDDFARLSAALPGAGGHFHEPVTPGGLARRCLACGLERVSLMGRPQRRLVCPHCNAETVDAHVVEFESARNDERLRMSKK